MIHLLTHIRCNELDCRLHFGHDALRLIDAIHTPLTEPFLLGNLTDGVDLPLDITGNELAVSPHPTLQIDKVVGVADGADALAKLFPRLREALVFLVSHPNLLFGLLKTWCRLRRTARTAPFRFRVVSLSLRLHLLERLLRRCHGLFGSPLFGGHRS